jgi:[ribosomal protein S5]-alanine N-acetyltransferase
VTDHPPLTPIPTDQPELESPRLRLRPLGPGDAADVFEWASDDTVTQFLSWPTHRSLDDTRRYLQSVLDGYARHEFAGWGIELKAERKLVGGLALRHWDRGHRRTEIGYVMNPRYQGRGIMTEAVRLVIVCGFEQLQLNRIEAHCFVENVASEQVMRKAGMTLDGTLRQYEFIKGRFWDTRIYALLRDDYLRRTAP